MDVSKDNVQNIYPLSPTQEGMLFHLLSGEDPEAYVQQISYRVRGVLDAGLFEASWNALIRRHDILRTAIVHTNAKQPLQVVLKQRPLDFHMEDLTGLGALEQAGRLERFCEHDRRTVFDPARAMLMRVALLRLSPELHEVVWSHHHIIMDGWSIGVLQGELVEIYRALAEGREVALPAAPPYSRYIRHLESLDAEASAGYWREYLKGYTQPATLPATASGPMRQGEEYTFVIPTEVEAGLAGVSREAGVTLNSVLQSVWAVLLGLYSGKADVVFGTVVSGRPPQVPGIDRMAGLFVNTVPLRIRIPATLPFLQVLVAVQQDALQRENHQYFPLAKAQAESELKQNLIACVTAMENYPVERQIQAARTSESLGYNVEHVRVSERTHYDLLVQFLPGPELVVKFQYNAAVHRTEAVERLARQYEQLLAYAVAQQADITVGQLQSALVSRGTACPASVDAPAIHRRIEAQAAAHPDVIAIRYEREYITYANLNARANQLARYLQARGVTRETRVGICCERSIGLIVSMLAVWKAGGAFVPMDPAYPAERLAYLTEDSEIHLTISDSGAPGSLSPDSGSEYEAENLAIEPVPSQAAYIIYTSGSTGRPKGCVVTQENVSRLFAATQDWFHFGASDIWSMFHSAAFDFSVWEIWGALVYGGRLVIVPYWVSRSPEDFATLLETEQVTVLNQTPSAFRQLLAAGLPERAEKLALRVVIFGGEALNPQSLQPWFDAVPADRVQLVNMYGITETTVHVTYRVITQEDILADLGSRIGVPIPDLSVCLLEGQGHAVPDGVLGEIHVGGAGVARGYWKRPALTAERFVPDLSGPPGSRLYRSGDLARLAGNGDLEYLGRADEQVKVRGFRIELGEIENAISRYAAVRETTVIALDTGEEKKLIAYVAGPVDVDFLEKLRGYLAALLPAYMIPAVFIPVEKLPLTAHGKVDRKALPGPGVTLRKHHVPPSTELEKMLAEVWQQVLGVPQMGVHDSYLEFGGDSITAIRIVSALLGRKLKIGVRDLFRYPTIAELAPHVEIAASGQAKPATLSTAPLAPIQAWFLAEHRTDPHWFNHAVFVHLPADADVQALQKAWHAVWIQHAALRLRFVRHDGAWTQELSDNDCPQLIWVDADDMTSSADEAQHGFDLANGPLARLLCSRTGEECKLLIVVHHLVIDSVSWQILLEDLALAYRQAVSGYTVELSAASGSYLQWCAAQQMSLEIRSSSSSDLTFGTYGDVVHQSLRLAGEDTADLLRGASAAYNTNPEELLLASLSLALRDWRGQDTTRILIESHGREGNSPRQESSAIDISRTVGWFTSIQPLPLHCPQPGDLGYLIRQTKETLRRIPRVGVTVEPVLLRFNYLGNAGARVASHDFAVSTDGVGRTVSPRAQRPVPLDLSAVVIASQLEISLAFVPQQFSADQIAEFLALYRQALQAVIRHCCDRHTAEVTPSDLTYNDLSLEELDRMLL